MNINVYKTSVDAIMCGLYFAHGNLRLVFWATTFLCTDISLTKLLSAAAELMPHRRYALSNCTDAVWLGLAVVRIVSAPSKDLSEQLKECSDYQELLNMGARTSAGVLLDKPSKEALHIVAGIVAAMDIQTCYDTEQHNNLYKHLHAYLVNASYVECDTAKRTPPSMYLSLPGRTALYKCVHELRPALLHWLATGLRFVQLCNDYGATVAQGVGSLQKRVPTAAAPPSANSSLLNKLQDAYEYVAGMAVANVPVVLSLTNQPWVRGMGAKIGALPTTSLWGFHDFHPTDDITFFSKTSGLTVRRCVQLATGCSELPTLSMVAGIPSIHKCTGPDSQTTFSLQPDVVFENAKIYSPKATASNQVAIYMNSSCSWVSGIRVGGIILKGAQVQELCRDTHGSVLQRAAATENADATQTLLEGGNDDTVALLCSERVPVLRNAAHLAALLVALEDAHICGAIDERRIPNLIACHRGQGMVHTDVLRQCSSNGTIFRGSVVGAFIGTAGEATAVIEQDFVVHAECDGDLPNHASRRVRSIKCPGIVFTTSNNLKRCDACRKLLENSLLKRERELQKCKATNKGALPSADELPPIPGLSEYMQELEATYKEFTDVDKELQEHLSKHLSVPMRQRSATNLAAISFYLLKQTQQQKAAMATIRKQLHHYQSILGGDARKTMRMSPADDVAMSAVMAHPKFKQFVSDDLKKDKELQLPNEVIQFFQMNIAHIRDSPKARHGRRYPVGLIKLALRWAEKSASLYEDLAGIFALPSVRVLQRYRAAFAYKDELVCKDAVKLFGAFKDTPDPRKGGYVRAVLAIDAMKMKSGVILDANGNLMGSLSSINIPVLRTLPASAATMFTTPTRHATAQVPSSLRSGATFRETDATHAGKPPANPHLANIMASHVMVGLLTGLNCGARCIAGAFYCSGKVTSYEMDVFVDALLRETSSEGISIDVITWDGASTNRRASLDFCKRRAGIVPNLVDGQQPCVFPNPYIDGEPPVVILPDAPHMYKRARNALISSSNPMKVGVFTRDMLFESAVDKREQHFGFKTFMAEYERDKSMNGAARFLNKISPSHLLTDNAAKMREGPALQLFSKDTIQALRLLQPTSREHLATAGLLRYLTLWNTFTDTVLHMGFINSISAPQITALLYFIKELDEWRSTLSKKFGAKYMDHFITRELWEDAGMYVSGVITFFLLHSTPSQFGKAEVVLQARKNRPSPDGIAIKILDAMKYCKEVRQACPSLGTGIALRLIRVNQNPVEHLFRDIRCKGCTTHPDSRTVSQFIQHRQANGGVVNQTKTSVRSTYVQHEARAARTGPYNLYEGNPLVYQNGRGAAKYTVDALSNKRVLFLPGERETSAGSKVHDAQWGDADVAPPVDAQAFGAVTSVASVWKAEKAAGKDRKALGESFLRATTASTRNDATIQSLSHGFLKEPTAPWKQFVASALQMTFSAITVANISKYGNTLINRIWAELNTDQALYGQLVAILAVEQVVAAAVWKPEDISSLFPLINRKIVLTAYRQAYRVLLSATCLEDNGPGKNLTLRQSVAVASVVAKAKRTAGKDDILDVSECESEDDIVHVPAQAPVHAKSTPTAAQPAAQVRREAKSLSGTKRKNPPPREKESARVASAIPPAIRRRHSSTSG
jgi:hypothetical protein